MDISYCIILASVEIPGDSILVISGAREELLLSSFRYPAVSSRGVAKKNHQSTDGFGREVQ